MGNMHQPKMHTANAQHSELNMAWNKLQRQTGESEEEKTKTPLRLCRELE